MAGRSTEGEKGLETKESTTTLGNVLRALNKSTTKNHEDKGQNSKAIMDIYTDLAGFLGRFETR